MHLNADLLPDVVVVSYFQLSLPSVVYFNRGGGNFSAPWPLTSSCNGGRWLEHASLNSRVDNATDIVMGCAVTNEILVMLSNGTNGTSFVESRIPDARVQTVFGLGHLDGDPHPDLLYSTMSTFLVVILRGNGTGLFGQQTSIAASTLGYLPALFDMDADGLQDIVLYNASISVVLFARTGFALTATIRTEMGINPGLTAADLDPTDGLALPDLVTVGRRSNASEPDYMRKRIEWSRNLGGGVFGAPSLIVDGPNAPWGITAVDVTGDGTSDVIVNTQFVVSIVSVYVNNGNGSVWTGRDLVANIDGRNVQVLDLDGDGFLDLLFGSCAVGGSWARNINVCPSLPALGNGTYTSVGNGSVTVGPQGAPALAGEKRHPACNAGYVIVGGGNRTCLASGSYSGSLSRCDPAPCVALVAPLNGAVVGLLAGVYRDTRAVVCTAPYVRIGPAAVSCQANGTWSPLPLCVAPSPPPPSPPPPPPPPPSPTSGTDRVVDPVNNIKDATNVRASNSTASLLLYILGALLVWLLLAALILRRRRLRQYAAEPDLWRKLTVDGAVLNAHSVVGLCARQPGDTFTRGGRAIALLLSIAVACVIAAALDLRARNSAAAAPRLLSLAVLLNAVLNAVLSFAVSAVLGVPLLRAGLRSRAATTRLVAAAAAAISAIVALGAAVLLIYLRVWLHGGALRFGPVAVSAGISLAISLLLLEPLGSAVAYFALGMDHMRVADAAAGLTGNGTAKVGVAGEGGEEGGDASDASGGGADSNDVMCDAVAE